MIAALVQRPEIASEARPRHRFALIDHPFAPLDANPAAAGVQAQLSVIHAARCDGVGRGTCPLGTHVLTIDLK